MAKRAKPRRVRSLGTLSPEQNELLDQINKRDREAGEKAMREWKERLSKSLSKAARALREPSIQVVLVPSEELSDRFESWLVLHPPDGKVAIETKLGKDSYSRDEAFAHLIEVFTVIGEKLAVREQLLKEIEAFLERSGMAATTFGLKAVNNWKLVDRLRASGDVTIGQAQRIRAFIASWNECVTWQRSTTR
jgi:hypothetical protein